MRIQTGKKIKRSSVQHKVDRSVITAKTKTGNLRNLNGVKTVRKYRFKTIHLSRKKYTVARADSEHSPAVEMVQAAGQSAAHVAGTIRTMVNRTGGSAGRIATAVKSGKPLVRMGSAKDMGKMASAARTGVKNAVKDSGTQLLRTKIDQSTVTDTGSEAIKQGVTSIQHMDNVRKGVINTARTSVKAGYAMKNMPRNTRIQVKRIKKNTPRTVKAIKKIGSLLVKVVMSKTGLMVIGTALALLIIVNLILGFIALIASSVSGLFGWMCPNNGNTDESAVRNNIGSYISKIQKYENEKQSEIDRIVNGLKPEYRYDGSQIEGLNKYGNNDLKISDYNAVVAVLATGKYRELMAGDAKAFSFSEQEIRDAVDKFYNFYYSYSYGYCSDRNCSIDENSLLSLSAGSFDVTATIYNAESETFTFTLEGPTYSHAFSLHTELEIYMEGGGKITGKGYANLDDGTWEIRYQISEDLYNKIDWERFYVKATTIYCNNSRHCYLNGAVSNFPVETVLNRCSFNAEERSLFSTYLEQINLITGG